MAGTRSAFWPPTAAWLDTDADEGTLEAALVERGILPPLPSTPVSPSLQVISPPSQPNRKTDTCMLSIQAKLEKYTTLKAQGTHINDHLARNRALKNPHVYPQLVHYCQVDETGSLLPPLLPSIDYPSFRPDALCPSPPSMSVHLLVDADGIRPDPV